MNKKVVMKQIRDSIHSYIDIPEIVLHEIIDTPIFQRLRQIEQTSMRTLYPCAHHDRFAHSLGVYHLGQLAYRGLMQSIKALPLYQEHKSFWQRYGISFQLACLLHDCAHAPMSHSFEASYLDPDDAKDVQAKKERLLSSMIPHLAEPSAQQLKIDIERYFAKPKEIAPHEMVSAIVTGEYYRTPLKRVLETLWIKDLSDEDKDCSDENEHLSNEDAAEYIQFMQRAIIGLQYGNEVEDGNTALEISFQNCLISLLNGGSFDVDKLDYIVRDSVQSGANNMSIDIQRILSALTLVEIHTFEEPTKVSDLVLNNSVLFTDCMSTLGNISTENDCECALDLTDARLRGRINGELVFKGRGNHLTTSDTDVEVNSGTYKLDGQSDAEVWFTSGQLMGRFIGQLETVNGGFPQNGKVDGVVHTKLSGTIKGTIIGNITTVASNRLSYAIGYSKSAMSVIEDTMIARNRLYLWIYAH